MAKTEQFTIPIQNEPGVVAGIARTLGDAKVNILALLGTAEGTTGTVQLVVEDAEKARKALQGAKIPYQETTAEKVEVPNQPGALAECLDELADSGVSLNSIYAAATEGGSTATVVIQLWLRQERQRTLSIRNAQQLSLRRRGIASENSGAGDEGCCYVLSLDLLIDWILHPKPPPMDDHAQLMPSICRDIGSRACALVGTSCEARVWEVLPKEIPEKKGHFEPFWMRCLPKCSPFMSAMIQTDEAVFTVLEKYLH